MPNGEWSGQYDRAVAGECEALSYRPLTVERCVGFACGCEAWLRLAVRVLLDFGLRPWYWLGLRRTPEAMNLRHSLNLVLVALVIGLSPISLHGQEVVDKMVATVNASGQVECGPKCLISYSDLLWQ